MRISRVTATRVFAAFLCKEKRINAAIKKKASSFEEIIVFLKDAKLPFRTALAYDWS